MSALEGLVYNNIPSGWSCLLDPFLLCPLLLLGFLAVTFPFFLFSISFPHLCKQCLPPQSTSNLHFRLMPYCPSVTLRVPVFGLATFWPRTSHQSRSVWAIIRKWFPMTWHLLVLQHYCYYWCLLHMSVRPGLLVWSGRVGKMPLNSLAAQTGIWFPGCRHLQAIFLAISCLDYCVINHTLCTNPSSIISLLQRRVTWPTHPYIPSTSWIMLETERAGKNK